MTSKGKINNHQIQTLQSYLPSECWSVRKHSLIPSKRIPTLNVCLADGSIHVAILYSVWIPAHNVCEFNLIAAVICQLVNWLCQALFLSSLDGGGRLISRTVLSSRREPAVPLSALVTRECSSGSAKLHLEISKGGAMRTGPFVPIISLPQCVTDHDKFKAFLFYLMENPFPEKVHIKNIY